MNILDDKRYGEAKRSEKKIKKSYLMAEKPPKAIVLMPNPAKKGSCPPKKISVRPETMQSMENITVSFHRVSCIILPFYYGKTVTI